MMRYIETQSDLSQCYQKNFWLETLGSLSHLQAGSCSNRIPDSDWLDDVISLERVNRL